MCVLMYGIFFLWDWCLSAYLLGEGALATALGVGLASAEGEMWKPASRYLDLADIFFVLFFVFEETLQEIAYFRLVPGTFERVHTVQYI